MSLLQKLTFILLSTLSLLVIACGKKAETKSKTIEVIRPEISVIEGFLNKQDIACENNQACPNWISKIVVIHGDKFKFCTGFLTDQNVIATSSSCLPNILRLGGQDCSKDVFFFFPKTANRPAERMGCVKVLQISQLEGRDPVLWRDDVSFLQLSNDILFRRHTSIIRDGVGNNKQFTAWMVDQQGDFSATIKKANCESVHNTYINPLVTNESSPNLIFADCPITNGGTGGPILDIRGKVRAMVSTGIEQKLREYLESTGLLFQGLKEMVHATNFACAPTVDDDDQLDDRECMKDLNYSRVDEIRSLMLSTSILFSDLRKKLEESLEKVAKHIRFEVKVISKGDIQETLIAPKCFRSLDGWLRSYGGKNTLVEEVKLPVKSFKRVMDFYGRIQATTIDAPYKNYFVQYSLKNLRAVGQSSVLMWVGQEAAQTYPTISADCKVSLL